MNKAVLILDMPKNCEECSLRDDDWCIPEDRDVPLKSKPDWCPLRELPQKKRTMGKESENDMLCFNAGWNSCIEEILKRA